MANNNILSRLSKLEMAESKRGRELLFILPPEAAPHGEDWGGCYKVTYSSGRPDALMSLEQVEALAETESSMIFHVVAAPLPDYEPPTTKVLEMEHDEQRLSCEDVVVHDVLTGSTKPQRNGIWPRGW